METENLVINILKCHLTRDNYLFYIALLKENNCMFKKETRTQKTYFPDTAQ